jgi:hypothetical protein
MDLQDWWDRHPRRDWEEDAACRGMKTEIFFRKDPDVAKRICQKCQVTEDCLVNALRTETTREGMRFGVLGGMTGIQRQAFYRRLVRERAKIRNRLGQTA